jgi:hypothetical protein
LNLRGPVASEHYEYRRRLIVVEKSWRDAQVAILFGKASRKAAFATNPVCLLMRGATAPRIGTARGNTITPTPIARLVTQSPPLRMSLGVPLGDAALGGRVGMGTVWAIVILDTRPFPLASGSPSTPFY